MSSNASSITDADITALRLTFINTCCQVAASTMIFHEHMMTLSDEIRLVWSHKFSGATLVFLLNRYLVLSLGVAIVLQTGVWDTALSCEATIILYDIVSILLTVITAVFSALRAYAIGGLVLFPAAVTLFLGLLPAFVAIYFMSRSSYAYVLVVSGSPVCDYNEYYPIQTYNQLILASRACAIAADVIVLAVTWIHTYRTRKAAHRGVFKTGLTTLLARDGTIFFVLLLALNIMQMTIKSVGGPMTNFASTFTPPVAGILISRFMLNLRHIYYLQSMGITASFIGNLGAPLYDVADESRSHTATLSTFHTSDLVIVGQEDPRSFEQIGRAHV